ncbi:hypothetical protein OEZ85_005456 [Tetradesmus obliquus]|uniref:Major facilitator superfamily (MFS) profile domain-containing protein n=1 Tax=Tetradesmus obliquus TaxID=3088 RepID=A0ABY8UI26_TETOB|nr:hypothetical protein OEZ85_005456 [Tetradesmus obliquus]
MPGTGQQAAAVYAWTGKQVFPTHDEAPSQPPLVLAAAARPAHKAAAAALGWMFSSGPPAAAAAAAQQGSMPPGAPTQQFALPVDAEFKACRLDLCSFARPHMRAFHLNWAAFFITFATTFAPAAVLPVLRDSLDLTATDIGNGGIASVCGAIGSRLVMGTFTDMFGPRYGAAAMLLGTAPFAFAMALVHGAAGYVAMRCMVGLGLSMFVVNQTWTTCMFNVKLVGRANALSAGWGNTGAGAALLLTPLLYEAFAKLVAPDIAWRIALFVPGVLQLLLGVLVLIAADDSPLGSFPQLGRDRGHFRRTNPCAAWRSVLTNYRLYVLALAYALCFGVELTTHNVIALYLFNHFGLSLTASGLLGGGLGLMNVVSRFLGGAASDLAAGLRGMRGRLWVLQVLLLLEGVFCLLVGVVHDYLLATCMHGNEVFCLLVGVVHDYLLATVGILIVFSFCCQMACGAVFGIVPFVSKRSTGTVTGIVAAGGSLGSAVTQAVFFSYFDFSAYEGFYWMGTSVICLSAFTSLLAWPMWGGMFTSSQPGTSEERYYISEYNSGERAAGLHLPALAFAHEARSAVDRV